MVKRVARQDVPDEQKWNSQELFQDWEAIFNEMKAIDAELPVLDSFQGTLADSPDQIKAWFKTYNELDTRLMRLYVYLHMATAVDNFDTTANAAMTQWQGLYARFQSGFAFADPEILQNIDTFVNWAQTIDELEIYKPYFEKLRQHKQHKASADVEQVLGMLTEPFSKPMTLWTQLANVDLEYGDIVQAGETVPYQQGANIKSANRGIRQQTWQNSAEAYLKYQNTFANSYIMSVQQNTVLARTRKYNSVLQMRMESQGLPTIVYDNLISAFVENLPTWHRYWGLKAKLLNLDTMAPYDIWASIVENPPVIPFEQAVDWISEAVRPLGDDYVNTLRKGSLEDGWIDRAVNYGKEMGAFANTSHDGSMPYIMISYDDTLLSMSTLAHELGHSMNLLLVGQNQPAIYNNYVLGLISDSVLETASNFHQAMTRTYLSEIKADDEQFMLAMIDEAMFNFHRYFFYMPSIARFEKVVYDAVWQGDALTAENLNKIMRGFMAEGYGNTMNFNSEYAGITWAQLPHIYRPFYSFQYAVGISAAYAMTNAIRSNEAGAVERYLNFAKLGGSAGGLDSFAIGGVDMTSSQAIENAFAVLDDFVNQLEDIAG